eukprot:545615-Alexandrium_andersonii.AAC.1
MGLAAALVRARLGSAPLARPRGCAHDGAPVGPASFAPGLPCSAPMVLAAALVRARLGSALPARPRGCAHDGAPVGPVSFAP